MFRRPILFLILTTLCLGHGSMASAFDVNLLNVNMGSPAAPTGGSGLSSLLGKSFGFGSDQVAPALAGPPQEVPAILQIAQSAGTIPMTVWMMRRMGFNYSQILQTFSLSPAAMLGGGAMGAPSAWGGGGASPWNGLLNPYFIEMARTRFFRETLGFSPSQIAGIPYGAWLPPGQAMKQGLWLPPGIAKKQGLWMPPGQAKKIQGKGWGPHFATGASEFHDDDDGGGDHRKEKKSHEKHGHGHKGHGKGH